MVNENNQIENKRIGIFSFGRKNSERCPNKMLKPFSDTTLTDIILQKLKSFNGNAFFAGYEKEFQEKCVQHRVRFVQRDRRSAHIDKPIIDILSFLHDEDYDYFIIINACLPFLSINTIKSFVAFCQSNYYEPAFAVIKRGNYYVDQTHKPLNFNIKMKTINTKEVTPVYEFAHALYFFNKDYFFKNGKYW